MIKIEGIKLFSNRFPFSWNEKELEVVFELSGDIDTWDKSFTVRFDKDGNITDCGSLTSSRNAMMYYIEMGKVLEKIKQFVDVYGKEMFAKLKENEESMDKTREEILKVIEYTEEKIKEETGYHFLIEEEKDLIDKSCELRKKRRRLRKEERIEKITKEIEEIENKLEDVRLEIEKIKIQIEEYNKESKKVIEEIDKKNNELIDNMFKNYMLKLEEV